MEEHGRLDPTIRGVLASDIPGGEPWNDAMRHAVEDCVLCGSPLLDRPAVPVFLPADRSASRIARTGVCHYWPTHRIASPSGFACLPCVRGSLSAGTRELLAARPAASIPPPDAGERP